MGDSDSGVGVKPGADSIFGLFGVGVGIGVNFFFTTGVGVGIGVNFFFTTGVGAGVGVNRFAWSRSRSQEFWSLSMHKKKMKKKCNVAQLVT